MYRFIVAALLCTACGVGSSGTPEETASVGKGVQAGCPDPSNPSVDYISQDVQYCLVVLFSCDPGQQTFSNSCGCGCIGPAPAQVCPSPSDPKVAYISQDPLKCAASLFQCDANQTTFNDWSCGCGCID